MKLAAAPGASEAAVKMGVDPLRLFKTTTLVSRILPVLLTEPL